MTKIKSLSKLSLRVFLFFLEILDFIRNMLQFQNHPKMFSKVRAFTKYGNANTELQNYAKNRYRLRLQH